MQMLAPPSIILQPWVTVSPFRLNTRGRPMACVTLSIGRHGVSNVSVGNGEICPLSKLNGNLNGVVGNAGQSRIPGSEMDPCGKMRSLLSWGVWERDFLRGIEIVIRPTRVCVSSTGRWADRVGTAKHVARSAVGGGSGGGQFTLLTSMQADASVVCLLIAI
jgi:hypothetical protein